MSQPVPTSPNFPYVVHVGFAGTRNLLPDHHDTATFYDKLQASLAQRLAQLAGELWKEMSGRWRNTMN